ncbi:uncharacterized protein LAJ45_07707 [Morchella importuna]|uniref:uncharacterized protein n=1 Tax=Morchella importuna TaxID=1174673 RepID=UPI001E8DC87C|nr:uncharacterized protein LAJ45_07707 [Morchella importuna]KAH8148255.1 hypothetical protein LAJ45_07707 [Morchella importuna]
MEPQQVAVARTSIEKETGSMEQMEKVPPVERDYSGAPIMKTDPAEIALVKKLDLTILPILWLMYFLNFLDRNAIVNGKLDGLAEDLKMKGSEYQTCISILFVGYLAGQVPSNMILTRVRPSLYMGGFMAVWAIISGLTGLVKNYHGMLILRFFLGVAEAPYYPGALYVLTSFYTRKEVAARMAIFYTGNIGSNAFAGLIAAGIFSGMDGKNGLEGWRWLFIITGAITFGIALVSMYLLPDTPLTTRWLSPAERQLAHDRIIRDTTEESGSSSTWEGFKQAVFDYRTWIFCLMYNFHLTANGFKNFFPSVVKTLGFNTTITLVLTCPPYLVACFTNILVCWSSGRYNERTWHITISKVIAIIGFILSMSTTNVAARYVAMMIFTAATYGVNNICMSWCGQVLGQTPEKKAVTIAIVNTLGNVSFVYSPYLWPDSGAPRYIMAMSSSASFSAGVVVCAWILRAVLMRENKRIRESSDEGVMLYAY